MGQALLAQEQNKISAAEVITQVRAMFNRNRVAVIYNKQVTSAYNELSNLVMNEVVV